MKSPNYSHKAILLLDNISDAFREEIERIAESDIEEDEVVNSAMILDAATVVLGSGSPWLEACVATINENDES